MISCLHISCTAPGEPPQNLFCRQGQEREIIAQWAAPPEESWNGELEGYVVYYKVLEIILLLVNY